MFDYHLHSDFSADCDTPMEKTVETAIKLGLKEICFTEHIDEDYPDPTIDFMLDLPAYDKKIKAMQSNYKDRIKIRKGLEIGVQPHLLNNCQKIIDAEQFDFVICSMHTTGKKALHSGDFFTERTIDEAYLQYYEELLYCITYFKGFQVLGHLDLVRRYTKGKEVKKDFHDVMEQIFKTIIPDEKGIEVNTSGFRYGLSSAMPSADILKLYKQCGGEIITVGSDSHTASTVGKGIQETMELLNRIGFKYVTTFENKQPIFHRI
ncbi:histidinol-phosphatase HisJ family protein [Virgibacillus proomii]|uniref:histidinol-phosphatase HisJ family protein n=1 Tax=Virgibacillus proomii TaxID=84407 RepID=UPI001C107A23|nr:histidinol-phosphatase HisJ family protein [Virgibacillus proomii]MBU5265492.1 histidinol-phosphatase HisJ family protein [Virgibacillus proomii]